MCPNHRTSSLVLKLQSQGFCPPQNNLICNFQPQCLCPVILTFPNTQQSGFFQEFTLFLSPTSSLRRGPLPSPAKVKVTYAMASAWNIADYFLLPPVLFWILPFLRLSSLFLDRKTSYSAREQGSGHCGATESHTYAVSWKCPLLTLPPFAGSSIPCF